MVAGFQLFRPALSWVCFIFAFLLEVGSGFMKLSPGEELCGLGGGVQEALCCQRWAPCGGRGRAVPRGLPAPGASRECPQQWGAMETGSAGIGAGRC